jgi:IstB-like ATP binding protein
MFSLVSNRYERMSVVATSNRPFSAWGEIFGDAMAATAMSDRLIHHSEILIKWPNFRPARVAYLSTGCVISPRLRARLWPGDPAAAERSP